jgi:hypothetical protein
MSRSGVSVTDAGGQSFSIAGCRTVGALKQSILEHTGIPVNQQRLLRGGDAEAMELADDAEAVQGDEELKLLVDLAGGCECSPFYIAIRQFECKFRCSICYNGLDMQVTPHNTTHTEQEEENTAQQRTNTHDFVVSRALSSCICIRLHCTIVSGKSASTAVSTGVATCNKGPLGGQHTHRKRAGHKPVLPRRSR